MPWGLRKNTLLVKSNQDTWQHITLLLFIGYKVGFQFNMYEHFRNVVCLLSSHERKLFLDIKT